MDIAPVNVEIERTTAMTVTFDDDVVCVFPVEELRRACPCATCRSMRDRGEEPWPRPGGPTTIAVADAEFSGAWGISISWSDGHSTGIYPWASLRRWHDGVAAGMLDAES
jgi:DUF971 family protein